MASIRRLWLNALFLLLTQREKCCGFNSSQSTVSVPSSDNSVLITSSTGPTITNSLTETEKCCGFSSLTSSQSIISTNINYNSVITSSTGPTIANSFPSTAAAINSTASSIYASVTEGPSMHQSTASTVISQSAASPTNMVNSSDALHALISSTVSSTVVSGVTDHEGDSEPKKNLYVWQLVAIGCGAFVSVPFIIIGLLCYQNRVLRKKLNASRSYSLPIKDNGAWIDSQDIPLWQKRASAFVSENPTAEPEGAPTLTT